MIFLSYSHLDLDFALKVAASLRNSGVPIWLDKFNIKTGDDWESKIHYAINNCLGLLGIISPNSIASKNCKREMLRADERNIPIFPVLFSPLKKLEDRPLILQEKEFIDFTEWQNSETYERNIASLVLTIRSYLPEVINRIPDLETQFLNNLLTQLEKKKGVLEYIELASDVLEDTYPDPVFEDEWGYSLLIDFDEKKEPVAIMLPSINEAIARYNQFVLVGKPGAGKTTTLRKIASQLCKSRLESRGSASLPLLLYLPEWQSETSVREFILSKWSLDSDPFPLLKSGQILLLLDGLNEMGINSLEKIDRLREWLSSDDVPKRVIITCREEDYDKYRINGFPKIITRDLNKEQVRAFLTNYLRDRAEDLFTQIWNNNTASTDRDLNRLVRNPYMLSSIIIIYQDSMDLPTNTGALFKKLARALWKRELRRNTLGWIPYDKAERLLSKLAFEVLDKNMPLNFPLYVAMEILGEKNYQFIEAAQRANFLEINGNEVRFFHQLMLEYFAAAHLYFEDIPLDFIEMELNEYGERIVSKWDNVVVALSGIVEDSDWFVEYLADIDPILAYMCVESGVEVSDSVIVYIEEMTTTYELVVDDSEDSGTYYDFVDILENLSYQLSENLTIDQIPLFTDLYYFVGDEYAIYVSLRALTEWPDTRREAAAAVLGIIGNDTVLAGLREALKDSSWFVAKSAASALEKLGNESDQVIIKRFYKG